MPTPRLTGCATSFLNCPCLQAWPSPTTIETVQPLCKHGHKVSYSCYIQLTYSAIYIVNYFLIQNPCTLNCTDMSNECDSVIRKKCILSNEYVPYINGEIFSHWSVKRVSYTSVVQWIVKS